MVQNKSLRLGSLDFVKFIAAILIVFHHFQGDFAYADPYMKFSGGQVFFGYIVELFFMISGFLVGTKNTQNQNIPFGSFIGARLKRLIPMATYSTVVFMILVVIYKAFFDVWYCCAPLSPIMILKALTLVYCGGAFTYQNIEPNCILWYLCVLIICFAVYWIVLYVAKKLKVSSRFLFAAVIFLGISVYNYPINFPFANTLVARGYISFFTGVVLVELIAKFGKKIVSRISAAVLVMLVLYGFYDIELLFGTGVDQQFTLVFIVYPAIIGFLVNTPSLDVLFNNKPMQLLGNISFEMYLCQYHVFMLIHLLEAFGVLEFPRSDAGMFLALALIIAMSVLVHFFVEKPITKAIKNAANRELEKNTSLA